MSGVAIAKISELLYEAIKNFKCYTKFGANSVGMTTKKLQYPGFTRKCRGVVRLSDIQALEYVGSSSYNNADNKCSITDDPLLVLPVSKARVQVIIIHSQDSGGYLSTFIIYYILCY
jgi:hypothetical protein